MLRPEFTRLLTDRLLSGDNINLQGDHGLGRRQTVEDLCSLLPENIFIARLDIRRDRTEQDSWLSGSLQLPGKKILILHNFDELDFEKESSSRFVEQLAAAGRRADVSLLLVTVSLPENCGLEIETMTLSPLP